MLSNARLEEAAAAAEVAIWLSIACCHVRSSSLECERSTKERLNAFGPRMWSVPSASRETTHSGPSWALRAAEEVAGGASGDHVNTPLELSVT